MAQEMSTLFSSFFPFYFTNKTFRLPTMASMGGQGNGHNDSPRDVNDIDISWYMFFFFPFFKFYLLIMKALDLTTMALTGGKGNLGKEMGMTMVQATSTMWTSLSTCF